jgi:hypothetical protein
MGIIPKKLHNSLNLLYIYIYIYIYIKRSIAQKIQRDTQGYKIVPLTSLP